MISITVSGAGAVLNAKDVINEIVEKGITNACLAIEAGAKERCPANTGTLRRSIITEVEANGYQIEGKVGTTLDYAPYVHEGTGIYSRTGAGRKEVPWTYYSQKDGKFYKTSGIQPHPFLEEAADEVAAHIDDYFGG